MIMGGPSWKLVDVDDVNFGNQTADNLTQIRRKE